MFKGPKLAVAVILAASGLSLTGISGASAGCRSERVFINYTCDWRGAHCVNHFGNKQICDAPRLAVQPQAPLVRNGNANSLVGRSGGGIVSAGGGNLIGNDGSSMRRR